MILIHEMGIIYVYNIYILYRERRERYIMIPIDIEMT